jgi:hypothetical protein
MYNIRGLKMMLPPYFVSAGFVMIREKIVSAMQSKNLAWHAEFERAIDTLTAVGMSDALGSALFRLKYCNDRGAYQSALALLAKEGATRLRVMPGYARKLAKVAIKEWALDADPHCHGSGVFTKANGVEVECPKCGGTGMRKWEDHERASASGIPVEAWPKHQRNFQKIGECLSRATADMAGKVNRLLAD